MMVGFHKDTLPHPTSVVLTNCQSAIEPRFIDSFPPSTGSTFWNTKLRRTSCVASFEAVRERPREKLCILVYKRTLLQYTPFYISSVDQCWTNIGAEEQVYCLVQAHWGKAPKVVSSLLHSRLHYQSLPNDAKWRISIGWKTQSWSGVPERLL